MVETIAVQNLLNEELARCKARNPGYSLRSLARRLKVSPATLSLLLNGRRPASRKFARNVCRNLGLDPKQENDLLALFEFKKGKRPAVAHDPELRLKADQFHLIADWHCFAILSLLETRNCSSDPKWIGARLGITPAAASCGLERLERLGLITQSGKSGSWVPISRAFSTTDEIASSAIRKNHLQLLELARASLETDPLEVRDFLSITMAIDPAKIPQAKLLMREFRQKLSDFLESGGKTEVYALALQLVPISRKCQK